MDLNRRRLMAGLGVALGEPLHALAQPAGLPRIGFLGLVTPAALAGPIDSLRAGTAGARATSTARPSASSTAGRRAATRPCPPSPPTW